jgi:hypothetical protein
MPLLRANYRLHTNEIFPETLSALPPASRD